MFILFSSLSWPQFLSSLTSPLLPTCLPYYYRCVSRFLNMYLGRHLDSYLVSLIDRHSDSHARKYLHMYIMMFRHTNTQAIGHMPKQVDRYADRRGARYSQVCLYINGLHGQTWSEMRLRALILLLNHALFGNQGIGVCRSA